VRESARVESKIVPTVKIDNVQEKRDKITKVLPINNFPTINRKIMKEHDNYFTFHRKLR